MAKITKDMAFTEVLQKYPQAAPIMMKHGLHCIGCHAAAFETVEQGCMGHGMDKETLEAMLKEMNEAVENAESKGKTSDEAVEKAESKDSETSDEKKDE